MQLEKFTEQEIARLEKSARERIITHWANNEDLAKEPKIFIGGEGCYLYDIRGRKILDTFSSLITTAIGHGRKEIKEAIDRQLDALEFFPNYHDGFTVPQIRLADKIAEITPGDLEVCFFLSSGSESNETALRLARQHHWANGKAHKYKVIARRGSYHGTTLGTASYTGFTSLRECFEPLLPGALFAPQVKCHDCELGCKPETCGLRCLKAVEDLIKWENPDTISAMIMDPLPGSNSGYPPPPEGYLQGIRELCTKHDIFLIFDEVQTGFGKTGKWFACENWGVTPDVMSISKAITSGYLPLGVMVTTKKIASVFNEKPGAEFRSGSTFGGHTLSCAAALANIKIIEKENLVERAAEIGRYLTEKFAELKARHRIVGEVHGMGTLWAIELTADQATNKKLDVDAGTFVRDWCWKHGMILRNNGNILVIAPALIITNEELDRVVDYLDQAIPAAMKHFNL
ncbi:MAG: aspartate aminotransferase family protein [Lentisphaerae bacterium]|jgi:putrescine aminotransferase|nr:aspartate aminotransferase family protein [Lentisphaerota bacterium]